MPSPSGAHTPGVRVAHWDLEHLREIRMKIAGILTIEVVGRAVLRMRSDVCGCVGLHLGTRPGEPGRNLRPWLNVINGDCLSSVLDMRSLCVACCRLSLPHRGGESLNR